MKIISAVFNPREFTGWHMFGVLVLFFGTIISVNMVLAFDAGSTWTGLVVKNSYVESQDFNRKVAVHDKQLKLGWTADINYNDGVMVIDLLGAENAPVLNAIVGAEVGRPVHEGEDRIVNFTFESGHYVASTQLGAGLWSAQIEAIGPSGELWVKTIRIVISQKAAG